MLFIIFTKFIGVFINFSFKHSLLLLLLTCGISFTPVSSEPGFLARNGETILWSTGLTSLGFILGSAARTHQHPNTTTPDSVKPVANDFDLAAAHDNLKLLDTEEARLNTALKKLDELYFDANKATEDVKNRKANSESYEATSRKIEALVTRAKQKRAQQQTIIGEYTKKKETLEKTFNSSLGKLHQDVRKTVVSRQALCAGFPEEYPSLIPAA